MTTRLLNTTDLVFYKNEDGQIMSGGYLIDSKLLQTDGSPMQTGGSLMQTGDTLKDLSVPIGLYAGTIKKTMSDLYSGGKYDAIDKHIMLPDDIYDSLFGLVEYDEKRKRKTRKHIETEKQEKQEKQEGTKKKSKKTRKNIT